MVHQKIHEHDTVIRRAKPSNRRSVKSNVQKIFDTTFHCYWADPGHRFTFWQIAMTHQTRPAIVKRIMRKASMSVPSSAWIACSIRFRASLRKTSVSRSVKKSDRSGNRLMLFLLSGVNLHSKLTQRDHLKMTHLKGSKAHRRAAPI